MNVPKSQQFIQNRLRSGPIRHDVLADELLDMISVIHGMIGKYLDMNLEQFEIGFMRAKTPAAEVAVWKRIAMAWASFRQSHAGCMQLPHSEKKAMIAALVAISMKIQEPELLGVPATVGNRLLACYDQVPGP